MKRTEMVVRAFVVVGMTVGATGCFSSPVNDLISGGVKLANGQIGDMTASEIKAISDTVTGVVDTQGGPTLDTLTLEQSQAVVDFLDANNLNTFADVDALVARAQQDPSVVQGLDALAAAFQEELASYSDTPLDAAQLDQLLRSVLGVSGTPTGGTAGDGTTSGSPSGV
jgi:hypothetical protein